VHCHRNPEYFESLSGECQLTAPKQKFVRFFLCMFVSTISGWLGAADPSHAASYPTHVKSITFGTRTIDRAHSMRWHGWTVSFGFGRPFGKFNEQGIALRGLNCASAATAPIKCHIFMSMKPVESFAHFCEISPDDRHALGLWPMPIDCPNEIKFYR
jgi:hypothetical protein